MTRKSFGIVGAVAVAAMMTTAFVHGQAQDGPGAPPPHARRGPGGPGGPGGPDGPFGFGRGPGGGPGGPLALLRQLDLSDEQRAQVRQVMESHNVELKAVGDRLRAAHKAQDDAIEAPNFDENAVRSKAAEVAAIQADAAVLRAKLHSEVFAVLTPDQQAKAAELKAQREARMQQFRERAQERLQQRRQRTAKPSAL